MTNPYPMELQAMADQLGGQSKVAVLLDVDRSCITRWLRKERPDAGNQVKIAGLHYILTRLLRRYHPSTAQKWLTGINAFLRHQRPMDLIKQGRLSEVISAMEQEEAGGYV